MSPPPPSQNEMVTLVNEMIVTAAANAAAAAAVGQLQRHRHLLGWDPSHPDDSHGLGARQGHYSK